MHNGGMVRSMYGTRNHLGRPARLALLIAACAALVQCTGTPDPQITTDDGSTMLLVPAGEFDMGGMEEDLEGVPGRNYLNYEAERPRHRVSVGAFYMDKNEVTSAQYRRFLDEAVSSGVAASDHPDQPEGVGHEQRHVSEDLLGDTQPAVGLNWYDAFSYCRWADKRLPTEAEWEYAARGPGETYRKFPWGSQEPDAEGIWWASYRPEGGPDRDGYRYSAPVGSFPDGISPLGILDLAGNAEEWVQDWYSVNYFRQSEGAQNPAGPATGTKRVIKGGSYESPSYQIRIAGRFWGKPQDKGPRIGFRCAMDVD